MNGFTSLVTGGIGFIGSHPTDRLIKNCHKVVVLDNFSSGKLENIRSLLASNCLTGVREDLKEPVRLKKIVEESEIIFHLAGNPEVRLGEACPQVHYEENILATFKLLEAMRQVGAPRTIVFTSTSTVYGEPLQIPTPEHYIPLIPISTYGASKLACEALIAGYAHTFNHRALILRFANVVGPESGHGVIIDFVKKIEVHPEKLEILGDGNQEKSYMHVADYVEAIMYLTNKFLKDTKRIDIYNVGSSDKISVKDIAKIVAEEMNVPNIEYRFTGGVDGGRGWKGDVKVMQLSVEKLLQTGWKPKYSSKQAVRAAARAMSTRAVPRR
jgi:UDP-glucose 4-epimerase